MMILTPLFVMSFLHLSLEQAKGDEDESQENRLYKVTTFFGSFLHEAAAKQREGKLHWGEGEKSTAAANVFELLLKKLHGKYSYQRLVAGFKCAVPTGEPHFIVHLQLLQEGKCEKKTFLSDCSPEEKLYCSWTGTLKNHSPDQTYGYYCFRSSMFNEKDKSQVAKTNPCTLWKYSTDGFYRLPLPAHMSPWSRDFLLYEPPVALLRDEKGPPGGQGLSKAAKNPEGRTGIAGRGLLLKWGENKVEVPIIVRKTGDRGVEVLVRTEYDKQKGEGPLPMFHKVPKAEKKDFPEVQPLEGHFHELMQPTWKQECSVKKLRSSLKLTRRLFSGYLSHPLTTDNAWITATVYVITTDQEPCFEHLDLKKSVSNVRFDWKRFNETEIRVMDDLVSAVFTRQVASTISAINFGYSVISLICFLFATAVIAILLSTTGVVFLFVGISATILLLAFSVTYYFTRKFVSVLDRV